MGNTGNVSTQVQSHWFMVLENGRLPSKEDWPLGGGMYPTNLKPEAHHHRSKWATLQAFMRFQGQDMVKRGVGRRCQMVL